MKAFPLAQWSVSTASLAMLTTLTLAACLSDTETVSGPTSGSPEAAGPSCSMVCLIAEDGGPFRVGINGDSATALTALAEFTIAGRRGDSVVLQMQADPPFQQAVASLRIYVSSALGEHEYSIGSLLNGETVFRFATTESVTLRYEMNRPLTTVPDGAFRLSQHLFGGEIVSANTPWIKTPRVQMSSAQPGSCAIPAPGTWCNITIDISPYVTGGPFGGFQSDSFTGPSHPIDILSSAPLRSVTITVYDSDFRGNQVVAYNAAGSVVGSVNVPYDRKPGVNTADLVTVSGVGIVRIQLVPADNDYVAYDDLSVTSDCITGDSLLDNPAFRSLLQQAMANSNPGDPNIGNRIEQGGNVWRDTVTGNIRFDPSGGLITADNCGREYLRPAGNPGEILIAVYHTHPYFDGDSITVCGTRPIIPTDFEPLPNGGGSGNDWVALSRLNNDLGALGNPLFPMYTFDKTRVWRLDPGTPLSEQLANPNVWDHATSSCTW